MCGRLGGLLLLEGLQHAYTLLFQAIVHSHHDLTKPASLVGQSGLVKCFFFWCFFVQCINQVDISGDKRISVCRYCPLLLVHSGGLASNYCCYPQATQCKQFASSFYGGLYAPSLWVKSCCKVTISCVGGSVKLRVPFVTFSPFLCLFVSLFALCQLFPFPFPSKMA